MAFKINSQWAKTNGTHLQGYLNITYQELELTLGKPMPGCDKSLAEWTIEGNIRGNWTVATIYDWKNYGGQVDRITDWHIGGHNADALELIKRAIPMADVRYYAKG